MEKTLLNLSGRVSELERNERNGGLFFQFHNLLLSLPALENIQNSWFYQKFQRLRKDISEGEQRIGTRSWESSSIRF